ncbi:7-cyano-7-deazaguanine synthase QueC [Hyphobacterium sp.]|uniref:7-cyano-7-deazaguanine synthase QueC n=1 Tax=Hyphobacterium sp. TaxID=2004662 RepID=UPI003BAA0A6E
MKSETEQSALVLFSGGQDSATALAWALDRFEQVETVGFDYGQSHDVELQARQRIRTGLSDLNPAWANRLGMDHLIDLRGFGALADSALTAEMEIAWHEDGLPTTFVPARNLVFLTVASALAYRRGMRRMVGGMCETDYSGYPDCRRATIDAAEKMLALGLERKMPIETPLMKLTKAETWALASEIGGQKLVALIVEDSHTCYRGDRSTRHDWGYGCGECPACELRAKGWRDWLAGK